MKLDEAVGALDVLAVALAVDAALSPMDGGM